MWHVMLRFAQYDMWGGRMKFDKVLLVYFVSAATLLSLGFDVEESAPLLLLSLLLLSLPSIFFVSEDVPSSLFAA